MTPTEEAVSAGIREAVGLDACYALIDECCEKYPWPPKTETAIRRSLSQIRERDDDPRLFLGVVGEFSTGKSTFINALLGDDLLSSDVLQGTTGVPTVISYGDQIRVEVLFANGSSAVYPSKDEEDSKLERTAEEDRSELHEFIHLCTANDDLVPYVTQVNLFHPALFLQDGLVVVDTPGLNAEANPEHSLITVQTLNSICDAAVIVTPAEAALSQSLIEFIEKNLRNDVHRCIYVLTKMDTIRQERERERVVKSVIARLQKSLGVDEACVLSLSPGIYLNKQLGLGEDEPRSRRLGADGVDRIIKDFEDAEQKLRAFTANGKTLIVAEKLSRQLSDLLTHLTHALKRAECSCERWHEHLEKNRIRDLGDFVAEEKSQYSGSLHRFHRETEADLRDSLQHEFAFLNEQIATQIESCDNKEALRELVAGLDTAATEWLSNRLKSTFAGCQSAVASRAEEEHKRFLSDFERVYESLHALKGNIGKRAMSGNRERAVAPKVSGLRELKSVFQKNAKDESTSKNWGTLVGGALGMMLLNPLTVVIGAGIGRMIGAMTAPSLEELKLEARTKSSASLQEHWQSTIVPHCLRWLEEVIDECTRLLHEEMDRHFSEYDRLVNELIEAGNQERKRIAELREDVRRDCAKIRSNCERFDRALLHLRGVQIQTGEHK